MGDAVIVAVPMISVMAGAVALIIWGSRRNRVKAVVRKAPWRVGTEPNAGGIVVYLYREADGKIIDRDAFGRVERSADDYQAVLLQLQSDAEMEAALLNENHR